MPELDGGMLSAALREDFQFFAEKSFSALHPSSVFMPNWHQEAIAYALTRVYQGQLKRLVISIGPRQGKSHFSSVSFPAWLLGKQPSLQIMCASYRMPLASELSLQCRMLMRTDWYKSAFPGTVLAPDKDTEDYFRTTAQGSRRAVSNGSTVMGMGADILIVDDLMDAAESNNLDYRDKCDYFFRSVLLNRLNQPDAPVVLIMHRTHEDDLVGRLGDKGWHILSFPAIADRDREYRLGPKTTRLFKQGELLHPERMDHTALRQKRIEIGLPAFQALWQCDPQTFGGLLKPEEIPRRPLAELRARDHAFIMQSWDTAATTTPGADWSVCTTWASSNGDDLYMIDVIHERHELPDLYIRAASLSKIWRPDIIFVEAVGTGLAFYQTMRSRLGPRVIYWKPQHDKISRVEQITGYLGEKKVTLPSDHPLIADLDAELRGFPNAKHDDFVDSFTQALLWRRELMIKARGLGLQHGSGDLNIPYNGTIITIRSLADQSNYWSRNGGSSPF